MAWTAPKTWTAATLTSSDMNTHVRDNMLWLGAATGAPYCRIYRTTAQSIPNATLTSLTFDAEYEDNASMHSTSVNTSRITIPSGGGGVYAVGASWVYGNNSTGIRSCIIVKNGGNRIVSHDYDAMSGGATTVQAMTIVKLAAADYIEAQAYQNSGGSLNVDVFADWSVLFWAIWLRS